MPDQMNHLSAEVVAAWTEGRLSAEERAMAEAHLAGCHECREEVTQVEDLLRSAPVRTRRFPVPLQLAAAAVLLLAIGLPAARTLLDRSPTASIGRTAPSSAARLTAIAPAADAAVLLPPTFVWHAADAGSRFRVTLVDEQGATVWSTETGDTAVTLPAEVALAAGRSYFWYVDALGADGRTMTSGAQRFTVR